MFLELIVENFRSIKSQQTLTLAKSKFVELDNNSFVPTAPGTMPLLTSAAIYGANAAGKSTFILALSTIQSLVVNSARSTQRGDKHKIKPFLLCESTSEQPTEFEVVFIAQGIKYQYGFALTAQKITEEWLYAYPNGKPQRWFIRAFDESENKYVWDFGSFFSGQKQLWKDSTRDNSLFLSTAVMLNSEQLQPVYDWFANTLKVVGVDGRDSSDTTRLCLEPDKKAAVVNFLKSADFDISDIRMRPLGFDSSTTVNDIPEVVRKEIVKTFDDEKRFDVKTVHKTTGGNHVLFDLEDESDGTQKLFSFAGPWIDCLQNGRVLFIDELHDGLHPNMVNYLVRLFHDPKTNPKNAQLIFTTHETSILDQNVFRRDQIWFCNKEQDQSTTLYPLTDFSVRKGAENLEKAYLSGRYGALPLISTLDFIGG